MGLPVIELWEVKFWLTGEYTIVLTKYGAAQLHWKLFYLRTVEVHGKNVRKGFWGRQKEMHESDIQNLVSLECLNEMYGGVRLGKN